MSTTNRIAVVTALERLIRSGGALDYDPLRSRVLLAILRSLGEGRPVSRTQVEQISDDIGIGRDDAHEFLRGVAEPGPDDTIVDTLGLTQNETSHHFTINRKQLYTLVRPGPPFLPTLLDQTASIESESPVSKTKVRLTTGPRGVEADDPPGAAASIVLVDPDTAEMNSVQAIWTAFCSHVFFLHLVKRARRGSRPETTAMHSRLCRWMRRLAWDRYRRLPFLPKDVNGSKSSPAARPITVRPVASIEELIRIEQTIAAQFPPRRSSNAQTLRVLKERFHDNRTLMLVAELREQPSEAPWRTKQATRLRWT